MSRAVDGCSLSVSGLALDFGRCNCVTCAIARQADRRDAKLMLRATRIAGADVTPEQRLRWDDYIAEHGPVAFLLAADSPWHEKTPRHV